MNKPTGQNVFLNPSVASEYDNYYLSEQGRNIDKIERKFFSAHLNDLFKGHLLELGCGTGHWTRFFTDQGFLVTAIDNSEAMLAIARSKTIQNAFFLKADATSLPFSDAEFSIIVSVTMLEFVENINKVMDEIDRVLKPGGTLVLGCLSILSELGKNKKNDPVFKHAKFFTPAELEQLLKRFGNPKISFGVYFSPTFELLDGREKPETVQPAFIAASVKK